MQNFPHSMAGHIVQVWMVRQDRYLVSELMAPPMDFGRQVMAIRQKMVNGQHEAPTEPMCSMWWVGLSDGRTSGSSTGPSPGGPTTMETVWRNAEVLGTHPLPVVSCKQLNGGVVTLERLREEAAQKATQKKDNPTAAAEEHEEAPLPLTETLAALATPLVTRSGGEDQFWVYMERPDGIFGMESTGSSASDIAGSDPSDIC